MRNGWRRERNDGGGKECTAKDPFAEGVGVATTKLGGSGRVEQMKR